MKQNTESFIMGAIVGVCFALAMLILLAKPVHAHTLDKAECSIIASDAKGIATERDHGITYKMQIEQLASLLPVCHERTPVTCVYKDDEDDTRAMSTIGWIYGDPRTAKLSPQAIHDRVQGNCERAAAKAAADEDLMEKLRQSHGSASDTQMWKERE